MARNDQTADEMQLNKTSAEKGEEKGGEKTPVLFTNPCRDLQSGEAKGREKTNEESIPLSSIQPPKRQRVRQWRSSTGMPRMSIQLSDEERLYAQMWNDA